MLEPKNRTDLFFATGWVLATSSEYPALRDMELVQRFASGDWEHSVLVDGDGLRCTCIGWSRRRTCWHMRFVLRWNLSGGEVGRFLTRLPDEQDAAFCRRTGSWARWLEDHVALVRWAEGKEGSLPTLRPPSIRS